MLVLAASDRKDYRDTALSHFLDEERVVVIVLFGDSRCASDVNQQAESIPRFFEQFYEFYDSLFCGDGAMTAFVQADRVDYLDLAVASLECGVLMRLRCNAFCAVISWPLFTCQRIAEARLASTCCTKNENANVLHGFICLT